MNKTKILITGVAGFIGMKVAEKILSHTNKNTVLGIDNLNSYYDTKLKLHRLKILKNFNNFQFIKADLKNFNRIKKIFYKEKPDIVINLAAQAGIRATLKNPDSYINSNLIGFYNLLECIKNLEIKHFIFASSSSVYGNNSKMPFSEEIKTDEPLNLYAATKKSNEILSHSYSHVFDIPTTGLRFFTVYGPWGRPDMLPIKLVDSIKNGKILNLYNHGKSYRDFTFIDDVTTVILKLMRKPPQKKIKSGVKYNIFNIGNSKPILVSDFIKEVESAMGKKVKLNKLKINHLDMKSTYSDSKKLFKFIGYRPKTKISKGINQFINWHNQYYS